MAKAFSSSEADRVIKEYEEINSHLRTASDTPGGYKNQIMQAVHGYVEEQAALLLQDIPVEEINREKKGIRVKVLKDAGYETMGDLDRASLYQLEALNGISMDGALLIKQIVKELKNKAGTGVKVRLNIDDKTPESTGIAASIYRYKETLEAVREASGLLSTYVNQVEMAVRDVKEGKNTFRYFFLPKQKKEKIQASYDFLNNVCRQTYLPRAKAVLDQIYHIIVAPAETAWRDFAKNPVKYTNILEAVAPQAAGADASVYGLPESLAKDVETTQYSLEGLKCQLRPYQAMGVKYILHQGRVLLGDEMGLGKTVQAIAAMEALKNAGEDYFMVICPASVLTNWCREIAKHSDLSVIRVHGEHKMEAFEEWCRSGGVAVTTYETTGIFQVPEKFRMSMVTVDEAHYIKNPAAIRTGNTKKICSYGERILFMTGTALENKVDEMVALINILRPDIAGELRGMETLVSAPVFRDKIAPVYYRRKREDVLTELPDLVEKKQWCQLLPAEESMYEDYILQRNYAQARRVSWYGSDLTMSSKGSRLLEIIDQAERENRKVIIFSFFLDTLYNIKYFLGMKALEIIQGSVSPAGRQEIVDKFEKAPPGTVLPAQIQAGGTGLNIQCASVVIICEPQFKPSIENQAISRAYRMGQTRNVLVYRLLCEKTVDELITERLEMKQGIFDAFADESVAADRTGTIDDQTFGGIMKEEYDRISAGRKKTEETAAL